MVVFVQELPSGTHTTSPRNLATLQPDNAAEGSTLQPAEAADTEDKNSGAVEGEKVPESESMEVDIVNDFLPPVPAEKYTGELQVRTSNRIRRYLYSPWSVPWARCLLAY